MTPAFVDLLRLAPQTWLAATPFIAMLVSHSKSDALVDPQGSNLSHGDGGVCAWIETRRELSVEQVRWVKRGYDILYELEEHKNIQRPDYVWQAAKNNQLIRLIALEFLHEATLREIALPEDRVIPAVREIAQGVVFLHKYCIMHRDLKPANILVHRKEGKILLAHYRFRLRSEAFLRRRLG